MPVSPLPQVRAVLDYAVTQIPPEKVFLGLSNYGYDWTLPFVAGESKAQSISNQRAIELAIQYDVAIEYDETAQAPFFHYTDQDGAVHEVWFLRPPPSHSGIRLPGRGHLERLPPLFSALPRHGLAV